MLKHALYTIHTRSRSGLACGVKPVATSATSIARNTAMNLAKLPGMRQQEELFKFFPGLAWLLKACRCLCHTCRQLLLLTLHCRTALDLAGLLASNSGKGRYVACRLALTHSHALHVCQHSCHLHLHVHCCSWQVGRDALLQGRCKLQC